MHRKLLYIAFGLVVLLATLHFIAIALYFYWTLWWYDYLMHFLGGLALGFFILSFSNTVSMKTISISIVCVMLLGGAWEIFEYINGIVDSIESYYTLDVIHDLIADGVGAVLAALYTTSRSQESF